MLNRLLERLFLNSDRNESMIFNNIINGLTKIVSLFHILLLFIYINNYYYEYIIIILLMSMFWYELIIKYKVVKPQKNVYLRIDCRSLVLFVRIGLLTQ